MNTPQTIEQTDKPSTPKGPQERYSVMQGDVAMETSINGQLVYEVTDRYCGGSTTRYMTIQRMLEWQPKLSKKTATDGIKDCLAKGFLENHPRSTAGTSAYRVTVIYNRPRAKDSLAFIGPVTPRAAPKRPKRNPTSAAPVVENGRVLHKPRPMCAGRSESGSPCRSRAKAGSDLCRVHDDKRRADNSTPGAEKSPVGAIPPTESECSTPGDFSDLVKSPLRTQFTEMTGDKKSPGVPSYSSGLEGSDVVTTDKQRGCLSTGVASQCGYGDGTGESESLAGVGQSESVVAGELLEDEGVINLNGPKLSEMTDTDAQSAPGSPTVGHFRRHPDSAGQTPTATGP